MISLLMPAAGALTAPNPGETPLGADLPSFALLMQGVTGAPSDKSATFAVAKPQSTQSAVPGFPEEIDLGSAEGLLAALDQTIARLEGEGAALTDDTVLAAFAEMLGEAPVETIGDLSAVASLDDPALTTALQERMSDALRMPIPLSQLSIVSAHHPAVTTDNLEGQAAQSIFQPAAIGSGPVETTGPSTNGLSGLTANGTTSNAVSVLAATQGTSLGHVQAEVPSAAPGAAVPPQDGIAAQVGVQPHTQVAQDALQIAHPNRALPGAAQNLVQSGPQSGQEAAVAVTQTSDISASPESVELGQRELPAVAMTQATLPQGLARGAPLSAPSSLPMATPEEQLTQHIGQQIRTVDPGEQKFRFSLTPYGMGEIEVEIARTETGRMQIAMTTETASVLNVLRHDRDQLLDALQSRGITANSADLDFQTFGERGRQDGRQAEQGRAPVLADAVEVPDDPVQVVRSSIGSGILDILT